VLVLEQQPEAEQVLPAQRLEEREGRAVLSLPQKHFLKSTTSQLLSKLKIYSLIVSLKPPYNLLKFLKS
jgi:hypothetical protein